jgi:hypothetical protein
VVGRAVSVDTSGRSTRRVDGVVSLDVSLDRLFFRLVVEAGGVSSLVLESVDVSGVSASEVCLLSGASSDEVDAEEPDVSVGEPVDVDVDDVEAAPSLEPLDDEELVEDEELVDDESDPSDGSADATPCPVNTAAPIPRATASPPTRPTQTPEPMHIYLPWTLRLRRHLG